MPGSARSRPAASPAPSLRGRGAAQRWAGCAQGAGQESPEMKRGERGQWVWWKRDQPLKLETAESRSSRLSFPGALLPLILGTVALLEAGARGLPRRRSRRVSGRVWPRLTSVPAAPAARGGRRRARRPAPPCAVLPGHVESRRWGQSCPDPARCRRGRRREVATSKERPRAGSEPPLPGGLRGRPGFAPIRSDSGGTCQDSEAAGRAPTAPARRGEEGTGGALLPAVLLRTTPQSAGGGASASCSQPRPRRGARRRAGSAVGAARARVFPRCPPELERSHYCFIHSPMQQPGWKGPPEPNWSEPAGPALSRPPPPILGWTRDPDTTHT